MADTKFRFEHAGPTTNIKMGLALLVLSPFFFILISIIGAVLKTKNIPFGALSTFYFLLGLIFSASGIWNVLKTPGKRWLLGGILGLGGNGYAFMMSASLTFILKGHI